METKSNKTIVLECYRKIIRDLDLSLVDEYIREDYIQHSPTVKDGKAGVLEMLQFLKSLPQPKEHSPSPIIRVIADGDLVAVHLDVKFMGKRVAVIDLFRLQDGLIAEHWDAGQEQPMQDEEAITMTNGTTIIDEKADSNLSKKVVDRFFKTLFVDGNVDEYIDGNLIDHQPNGRLLQLQSYNIKVHRLIAEGDFVVAQCEYSLMENKLAHYSIFRIADDKIVEHWSAEQPVPLTMAHNNGMF